LTRVAGETCHAEPTLLSLRSLPERQPAGPFGKRSLVTPFKVWNPTVQVSLNQSLSSTLRVGGHAQAARRPPLHITQRLQLAQMRYCTGSPTPTGSLPLSGFWWKIWNETGIPLTDNLLHGRMIDRPGRLPHQQGLCEARLGYRDASPGTGPHVPVGHHRA